jgi:hypothetical protein
MLMHSTHIALRRYGIAAVVLLFSFIVASLGVQSMPVTRAAVAAAGATVIVRPLSAEPGTNVTVSVSGVTPGEQVQIALSATNSAGAATGFRPLVTIAASGASFHVQVAIPVNTPGGTYYIRAFGLTSHAVGYARLIVAHAKAHLTVSPASFSAGDTVRVAGTGFYPNEAVTITINSPSNTGAFPLGQAQANASGAFDAPALRVPFGVTAGRQVVTATGHNSNRQGTIDVTVVGKAATITLRPDSAKPGTSVTVTGAHFQPEETVAIDLVTLSGSVRVGTTHAYSNGALVPVNVTIPSTAPEGTLNIVATGTSSHASATAQIKITALPASLSLSPTLVRPGATVSVHGQGFIPGEAVSIGLSGANYKLALATTVAAKDGTIAASNIQVPAFLPAGTYTVTASGQTSGRAASSRLGVMAHPSGPTLSITGATPVAGVYPVNPGSLVQVAGSGFPAGATVTLRAVGPSTITLLTTRADARGIIAPIGLTIPVTTPAGAYTLEAVVAGRALASVHMRVQQLAPRVTLSQSSLAPGQTVAVNGAGYAANEQVVLALNGVALTTTPSTVLTNPNGRFTAAFVVPQTVTSGTNVLTASGTNSRATATVNASSNPPVASRWYFVNGDTTNGRTTTLSILNSNDAVATVKMTFLYQGAPEQFYTVPVPAHAVSVVDLGLVAGTGRTFATILEADHLVSAQSTLNFPGGDNESTLGATGPATRWYLAEGYTNGSFSETLQIMNPNSSYATVDVQFLPFNNKPARETRFVMLPNSVIQVNANQFMPGLSISAIVSADKGIVVERSMHFGLNGRGFHDKIGTTASSTVWLFSQGEAAADRQTFFTILNPNQAASAAVTATFYNSSGQPVGAHTIVVDPLHRGNIKLNDVLPSATVATVITSNVPVVVERPFYQGPAQLAQAPSGSVVFGRNGGGLSWAFPGGSTANGDQTSMYLFNPGIQPVQVKATFYTDSGAVVSQTVTMAPNSDIVLNTASVPGMPAAHFGAVLQSTNGQPFVAEESVQNPAAQTYSSTAGVAQ